MVFFSSISLGPYWVSRFCASAWLRPSGDEPLRLCHAAPARGADFQLVRSLSLGGFRLRRCHVPCPLPSRHRIRHGARPGCTWRDDQSLLRRRDVGLLASPDLQGRLLDGARKREHQRPGQSRLGPDIHGVQAGRGQFAGLAARQERDPRNGGRDGSQETSHRGVGHLVHRLLLGQVNPGSTMLGFRIMPSSTTRCVQSWSKTARRTSSVTSRHRSSVCVAVHQHLRLDDRDESGFLAQRRVAGQRLRVGLDAAPAGHAVAHGDHRAPLGKAGAHLGIFRQAVAQSVQALGDLLSGMTGQVLRAGIDLDAGDDPGIGDGLDERSAVLRSAGGSSRRRGSRR